MASVEKVYENTPNFLLNILYDIVEMRKATVTHEGREILAIDTEMYGIKTGYIFRIIPSSAGTSVEVETEGNDENAERRAQLMLDTLDNMIGSFAQAGND